MLSELYANVWEELNAQTDIATKRRQKNFFITHLSLVNKFYICTEDTTKYTKVTTKTRNSSVVKIN